MITKVKSLLIFFAAAVLTITIAFYQRMTGPSYPKKFSVTSADTNVTIKLPRSCEIGTECLVTLPVPGEDLGAAVFFKRFKSSDDWQAISFEKKGKELSLVLPEQPPAGKLAYFVEFSSVAGNSSIVKLGGADDPVVIRFHGAVPGIILYPHILFMFLSIFFANLAGLDSLTKGKRYLVYGLITIIILFIGGLVLGPIMQKYAFGEYWTGFPLGKDLTDTKTVLAFLVWTVCTFISYKRKERGWILVAAVLLIIVYLVPHSMFGSELDYNSGKVITG